jgi:hypothetical protein
MVYHPARGALELHPAGRPCTADLLVADSGLGDSVAEMEDGVRTRVVHSAEETGAPVPSVRVVLGRAVRGQSGGTETSAQLLTGPAGLVEAGRPVHHGPPGLVALLRSLLLPSTQPHLLSASLLTPLPALGTRLLKLRPRVLPPPRRPLAPVARVPSPLQVVRRLQPSWGLLPCYEEDARFGFCKKVLVLIASAFPLVLT